MNTRETKLVKESFDALRDDAAALSLLFYGRLFELDPSVRSMFHGDIGRQGMKLVQTLSVVIEALDRFEDLTPTLHALGQRHSAYGAVAQHYELVEEALVWAVGQVLGAGPGSEVLSAWRSLLRRVSAAMLDGVRMLAEGAPTEVA